jgi:hypothetical protein
MPNKTFINVDLPAPFSPSSAWTSPLPSRPSDPGEHALLSCCAYTRKPEVLSLDPNV